MRYLLMTAFCAAVMSFTNWQPDFATAKEIASKKHQLILLNFSGSDWCGPCIRMRREVFGNDIFSKMADTTLVMVNADFPRNQKNQLAKLQQQQNNELADKYNASGAFPYTVLLSADGKVLKAWNGFPNETAEAFTTEVKNICDANK